jgi:hypothetical protein
LPRADAGDATRLTSALVIGPRNHDIAIRDSSNTGEPLAWTSRITNHRGERHFTFRRISSGSTSDPSPASAGRA